MQATSIQTFEEYTSELNMVYDKIIGRQETPNRFPLSALNNLNSLDYLCREINKKKCVPATLNNLIINLPYLHTTDSIMGHIRVKPFGYAGDFHIIDRIYQYDLSENYRSFDDYTQKHPAAQAVRNRKTFFKNLVRNKLSPGQPFVLLNVASGPARDLLELYEELPPEGNLRTDCVELDTRAIDYARNLCQPYLEQIHFMHKNVLRYQPGRTYDLIWSAGLFDYFPDKTFVHLLCRFKSWVKPGGEIVIGNFNAAHNPSRDYMEVLGEWFLIHRTAEELRQLALQAGYAADQITVDREPLNINLFLRIKG